MRKLFGICLCLALIASVVAPVAVNAAEPADTNADIIYFLNPTAIAAVSDYMFVADNIDGSSALLCFDVSGEQPKLLNTTKLEQSVVNLAGKGDDGLYVILQDKIVEYSVNTDDGDAVLQQANTISVANAVDVTYGVDNAAGGNNEYILTESELTRNNIAGSAYSLTGAKACIAIGNYIYFVYQDNSVEVCRRYDGSINSMLDALPGNFLSGFGAKGLFVWETDKVAVFNGSDVKYIEIGSETCSLATVLNYKDDPSNIDKNSIVDVTASDSRLCILNDSNKIDVYDTTDGIVKIATIGDDTVKVDVPTEFTSFTLARPTGYPTNLVYKTTDEDTSVAEIIKNATEYIILGYDEYESSPYYYVLVGSEFGWVQRSEGASVVDGEISDDNLDVVDTTVSNDDVNYKTKFNSANAVYVSSLPLSDAKYQQMLTQTASNMIEVTVLQEFVEQSTGTVWYYVSFEYEQQATAAFVNKNAVGSFYIDVNPDTLQKAIGDFKINSSLFEAVKVYENEDLSDEHLAHTSEGNVIKLYSGKRVTLVSEKDGVALIQIQANDGTTSFGYVASSYLIDVHAMTTNAIVGLSLLGAAIILATVLVVVYLKRKNGKSKAEKSENTNN